jgi:hypothetical protein
MSSPIGYMAGYDGYMVLVFPHEYRLFSTVIIRSTANRDLIALRHAAAFDAVARAIPALAEWTDPAIAEPVTSVLPGGALMNVYRGQSDEDGRLILPGLIFLGDAVCTTTPNFGRGLTTTMMQCTELLALLDAGPWHLDDVGEQFDRWCDAAVGPGPHDHRRRAGRPVERPRRRSVEGAAVGSDRGGRGGRRNDRRPDRSVPVDAAGPGFPGCPGIQSPRGVRRRMESRSPAGSYGGATIRNRDDRLGVALTIDTSHPHLR